MKVLVFVDGSEHAHRAFQHCVDSVLRDGDELYVMVVCELHPARYQYEEVMNSKIRQRVTGVVRDYSTLCDELPIMSKLSQPPHIFEEEIVADESVDEFLADELRNRGIDLALIGGTHGPHELTIGGGCDKASYHLSRCSDRLKTATNCKVLVVE
mmetsp:Transcript_44207/g.71970  ORF Transcript_44207/g.71970 Transcript_44207/m.71970 type:complete len:155 (-) Transcript_44207:319-783(-)|eukprot:CAMPEP_0184660320 /NCGR_PEP_ID=MMETSP0308-20130426/33485_1 /TAXON_ID=38269 /ORGANISM="Gloeochaete witrockiana, Strain SAG 46.84" /LENGTH=154 /DNA_ID=CAMNT_0027100821 /DNA_START=103 /DNA_END=570 /DNA_ORIENTATION=-